MSASSSRDAAPDASPPTRVVQVSPELEQELRDAIADIERGDCIELTAEQLREWAEAGKLPVLDEWLESHD